MIQRTLFLVVITSVTALIMSAPARAQVHVSPTGSDANPGSSAQPVASLPRALALSRAAGPKHILLHSGDYHDISLELTPADSGLTLEAAPDAHPRLYGGIPLAGWRKDDDRFWSAPLPPNRDLQVRLLVVDGKMAPRARYPREGVLTHRSTFDVPWMSTTGGGWKRKPTNEELTTLIYRENDLGPWLDIRSAEITVFHMWDESTVGVAAHDPARQTLTLAPPLGHPAGAFGVKKYILWNIREGMTAPGQWYHDRTRNRIVYWPLPNQDMARAASLIPTQDTLLRLRGQRDNPIRNITLRNLALSIANVPLLAAGFAAERFDGAISLDYAENCRLSGLTVQNVAGHAINGRRNGISNRIENCEVGPCGAGGIYVGGTNIVIDNNHVHDVGLAYPSAVAIYRGGKNNLVTHNEVHGCPYSGINYGGEDNRIESNLIYDCMKVLHDGAGIYVFGAKRCILRGNIIRDITDTGGYGASAYYLDEQSEDSIVEANLSLNVGWPSHNHMARRNTIRNNVFLVPGDARITFPRCADYTVEKNIVIAAGRIRIENPAAVTRWSNNLFHSAAGKVEGVPLKDYSPAAPVPGLPGDTRSADPRFRDPANLDFRFQPNSPAPDLGIAPIDVRAAGRRK